jgi:hypothetical protein
MAQDLERLKQRIPLLEYSATLASAGTHPSRLPSMMPWFECTHTETPTPVNPLGVKGVGEAGAIGAPPADFPASFRKRITRHLRTHYDAA